MDRKHCSGCRDNFYNHNNMGLNMEDGKPGCWNLKTAKIIKRKEVPLDQRPPWNQPASKFPDCYHKSGYTYVAPDRVR